MTALEHMRQKGGHVVRRGMGATVAVNAIREGASECCVCLCVTVRIEKGRQNVVCLCVTVRIEKGRQNVVCVCVLQLE